MSTFRSCDEPPPKASLHEKVSGIGPSRGSAIVQCCGVWRSNQPDQARRKTDWKADLFRRLHDGAFSLRPASQFERVCGLFLKPPIVPNLRSIKQIVKRSAPWIVQFVGVSNELMKLRLAST